MTRRGRISSKTFIQFLNNHSGPQDFGEMKNFLLEKITFKVVIHSFLSI